MSLNVLILAPHPDDEVLGCGGIIARYASAGARVHVLVITRGIPEIFPPEQIEETRRELAQAHELLGVCETRFLDFPAPRLDTIPHHQVADALRREVVRIRPDVMYIPHSGDIHADHKIVHHAAMVAARPRPPFTVKKVLSYETLSETDWALPVSSDAFMPNVFVDISAHLDRKLQALACYQSQILHGPPARAPENVEALARLRGSTIGVHAAEAFMLMREIVD
ncbi:MAG: PIG-L family deacetylase [Flavobacteriales bacterium]|nr:PIG-L family deacetylase [Flavobacteriales bacterium]MCX7650451.1 PIG-L family deacetylase [Flavobacteriales bacterium]MDW8432503.1 PIG-L deacetylase family protein [Flavobacteriales bacterium]